MEDYDETRSVYYKLKTSIMKKQIIVLTTKGFIASYVLNHEVEMVIVKFTQQLEKAHLFDEDEIATFESTCYSWGVTGYFNDSFKYEIVNGFIGELYCGDNSQC